MTKEIDPIVLIQQCLPFFDRYLFEKKTLTNRPFHELTSDRWIFYSSDFKGYLSHNWNTISLNYFFYLKRFCKFGTKRSNKKII